MFLDYRNLQSIFTMQKIYLLQVQLFRISGLGQKQVHFDFQILQFLHWCMKFRAFLLFVNPEKGPVMHQNFTETTTLLSS